MFIQTQKTPNPNSLKFVTGKKVSTIGSIEISKNEMTDNILLKNIFSVKGVESIFLTEDWARFKLKYDLLTNYNGKSLVIRSMNINCNCFDFFGVVRAV